MKFEDTIKKISSIAAGFVIFFLASGIYLSAKGFQFIDGEIVLVKGANASELSSKNIPNNIVIPGGRSLGSSKAPVTLYEYSSLGCYHCADFHLDTLPQIKKEYVDKGLVRIVFSDFPLDQKSLKASLVASCMPNSNYYDFIALLFKKQREWSLSFNTEKTLAELASQNGLSESEAYKCMSDKERAQDLISRRQEAMKTLEIQGTPTFVIANRNSREVIFGALDFKEIKPHIDKKL